MQRRPCLCGTRRSQQRTPRRGRQARIRVPEGAVARQEGFGCTRTQPVRLVATKEWPTQEHRRAHVSNRRSEQIPTTPSTADRCKPQEHGRRSQARAGARGRVARVTPSAKGRRGDGARASPRPRHGATGTHRDVPVEARRADLAARRAERRGAHRGGGRPRELPESRRPRGGGPCRGGGRPGELPESRRPRGGGSVPRRRAARRAP
eukprot:gene12569-biopygen5642